MKPIVIVKDLEYGYSIQVIVKSISFEVFEGEVLTLLGPNGVGKTTLLKCINALLKPKVGVVYVDGKEVHKLPEKELAKVIGYVPQEHKPSFPYTILDVVLMGRISRLGIFSIPSKRDYEKAYEVLKLVGIDYLAQRPYTEISGGEKQLTLIARALAQEPKVLLLDEPTAHLDFKNQVKVLSIVRKLAKKRNVAVIMALHDPNLAYMYSDKIALMWKGQIFAYGKPSEVITKRNIEKVYGLKVEVINHGNLRLVIPKSISSEF